MIELKDNELVFSFPEVHNEAVLSINFQRTLRIPDDGEEYPLPPGMGRFPLRHVDDFASSVPDAWLQRGGVMLPMYQSEAMWLYFSPKHAGNRGSAYPFAIKVAAGKINAVTGDPWSNGLHARPQDYMVAPTQPWLDGFSVKKGLIRQFVAMPLGSGYSAEEQITGEAEHGGVQIVVYPMKSEVFERRFPKRKPREFGDVFLYSVSPSRAPGMGLAPGGLMRQHIYGDKFGIDDWDLEHGSRCFVHICNSLVWRTITGANPPLPPFTAKEYTRHGMPWFDYYSDAPALEGSAKLNRLKSVAELSKQKGEVVLPENETVTPENIVKIRKNMKKNEVREGVF